MKLSLRTLMTGLGTALFLAACGGGGSDDGGGNTPPVVQKPTAVANADQTRVPIGTLVTLDGSGSTTPNNGTIAYQWSLPGKPGGSTAELSSSTDAKPGFTPDLPGEYIAALIVNDGTASSDSTRVTITATNPNPVAVINPETQGVLLGTTVTLDGSNSNPPTGVDKSELRYQWSLTERPDGDTAELQNAQTATASFLASQVGIYKARLKVSHGERSSEAEATITVNTANSAPTASIQFPENVDHDRYGNPILKAVRGQPLTLDGSTSSDPDGDPLSYRWSFPSYIGNVGFSVPYGSSAVIHNAQSAKAEFTPDAVGTYYIDFTTYDASVATTQRIVVQASKPEGVGNTPPVAVLGRYATLETEFGGWAGLSSTSYDIDGDALTYQWTWWNTNTPEDKKTATGGYLNLGRDLPVGIYQAELIVNDGQTDSTKASMAFEIKIGANTAAPNPLTKVEIARVLVGETITFDGSGSTDRNGDQIAYLWTLIDRPDGSNAVIQNATSAQASVVTDRPGQYTARLQVSDHKGAVNAFSPYDTVSAFAKAKNNPPVVTNLRINAQSQLSGGFSAIDSMPGQPVVLKNDGTAPLMPSFMPFDPDLDNPLYALVSATKQPPGSKEIAATSITTSSSYWTNRNGNVADEANFVASAPGEYELLVLLSDGVTNAVEQRIAVTAVNRVDYPTLLLEIIINNWPENPQLFFPYVGRRLEARNAADGTHVEEGQYLLTAFDRDYTITDLHTSATDSSFTPTFVGLTNGQVIRKGESVKFTLTRPAIKGELKRWEEAAALSGVEQSKAFEELHKLVNSYGQTWFFRVAEKEGYTFYLGPGQ